MQIEKSQNSRPFHKPISIEFVCHGNMLRDIPIRLNTRKEKCEKNTEKS